MPRHGDSQHPPVSPRAAMAAVYPAAESKLGHLSDKEVQKAVFSVLKDRPQLLWKDVEDEVVRITNEERVAAARKEQTKETNMFGEDLFQEEKK